MRLASLLIPLLAASCLISASLANAASWNAESVLKTYILEHYPWQEVDISGIELSGSAPASAPVSILAVKAPPGRALFKLTFKDSRTILASANVKTFDRVFKSRSALPKGYVINQDDIYATLMESALIPRGSLRDEQQLVGHSLLRSVVSNAPLTNETVSASPLVKRGRRVILLVESPGFLIKATGETRNDAPVGALVKVENLMSRKIVTGLLVDESTVRVEY